MWRWILIIVLSLGAWRWWTTREVTQPPGILVTASPEQVPVGVPAPHLTKAGYRITPLQRFSVEARVLGAESYWFDRGADLAPVDLALGWGPMSDTSVLERITLSQMSRFYFWHVSEFPIPRREIETNSANMHMIPADSTTERTLKGIRVGQIVRFSGYLIEADGSDGFRWRSSLTRDDTGNGACELVWVEELVVE